MSEWRVRRSEEGAWKQGGNIIYFILGSHSEMICVCWWWGRGILEFFRVCLARKYPLLSRSAERYLSWGRSVREPHSTLNRIKLLFSPNYSIIIPHYGILGATRCIVVWKTRVEINDIPRAIIYSARFITRVFSVGSDRGSKC